MGGRSARWRGAGPAVAAVVILALAVCGAGLYVGMRSRSPRGRRDGSPGTPPSHSPSHSPSLPPATAEAPDGPPPRLASPRKPEGSKDAEPAPKETGPAPEAARPFEKTDADDAARPSPKERRADTNERRADTKKRRADTAPGAAREFHLDRLDIAEVHSGRRKPRWNASVGGNPLRIGGVEFERGLGTHARGDLYVRLFGEARRFAAKVGVDSEVKGTAASVEFVVFASRSEDPGPDDGKVLWRSGVMRAGDPARSVDVDVSGVELLALEVTDAGDGNKSDHADWADAVFVVAGRDPVATPIPPGRFFAGLDPFYKKHASAGGLLVVSSEKVSDAALGEAAYLLSKVLEGRDDILLALIRARVRVGVMAYNEMTTDIPEHSRLSPWFDKRARGLGGNPVTCAEENLLSFEGDPYRNENILIHEFAHIIHARGLGAVDETFDGRLKTLYEKAKETGRFRGYGMGNRSEFWAEGVQSWFDCNRAGGLAVVGPDGKRLAQINTREELKARLPDYARLLEEVFRDNKWTYVNVRERLHQPHLAGHDAAAAPVFKWPKRVNEAFKRIEAERKAAKRKAAERKAARKRAAERKRAGEK